MADASYQPKVYRQQGGDRQVVASGGSLDIESGGEIDVESGGALKIAGTAISADAAELNKLDGVTAGTVTASKAVVVGANKNLDVLAIADLKLGAGAGTSITPTAAKINLLAQGVAADYKIARGQHTTLSAADTVVTGLTTVVAVVATLDSDPVVTAQWVSASIGDQAGSPVAGSIYIKTWKPTAVDNATPVAASDFTKLVNWIAIGT